MKKLSLNDLDNDISSLGIEDLVIFGALFFCCTGATICFFSLLLCYLSN